MISIILLREVRKEVKGKEQGNSKETSFVLRDQDGALKYQGGEEEERKEHIL